MQLIEMGIHLPDKYSAHASLYTGHLSPIAVFKALYKGSRSIRGAVGAEGFLMGAGRGFEGRVGVADACWRAAPLIVAMVWDEG